MNTVRRVSAIGLLTMWSIAAAAQEAEPEAETEAPPSTPETASETASETAPAPEAGASDPPPESTPLDELFIPSQEIAADEEVIFPVDI